MIVMAGSLDLVVFVELPMITFDDSHDLFVFWNNNFYVKTTFLYFSVYK